MSARILILAAFVLASGCRAPARGVVLMIGDGFGTSAVGLARAYAGEPLALDAARLGAITVAPVGAVTPDSAATATAMATGVNSVNEAIGVDAEFARLITLLEAAEARGLATGVVTNTRLSHATPAAFTAHVPNRSLEADIAAQQILSGAEVLLGGGAREFVPFDLGGRRVDGRNLIDEWTAAGGEVVFDREGLAAAGTPVLGLFHEDHMSYVIDHDEAIAASEPSLAEMTLAALDRLEDDDDGFLLVVEGGKIDHAGHNNDAAAQVHESLAFDATFAAVVERARARGQVLVVATADHETGGLALGWAPTGAAFHDLDLEPLRSATTSFPLLAADLVSGAVQPREALTDQLGFATPEDAEIAALAAALEGPERARLGRAYGALIDIVTARTRLAWTTRGHTAVEVPVHAVGPGAEAFEGVHPNTHIGAALAAWLGLEIGTPPPPESPPPPPPLPTELP